MTSGELGYELVFLPGCTLIPSSSQVSSKHGPIARDLKGSLLGPSYVNNRG